MFFTRASHDHGSGTAYDLAPLPVYLELRSGLNPSGQLVVSLYEVVIKAIIEFSCVQYVDKVWIGLA